jgi:hypothetical protein
VTGHQFLTWHLTKEGLALTVDDQIAPPLPAQVAGWMREPIGPGTTADPAHDVLRLEAQLRGHIAELRGLLDEEERRFERAAAAAARSVGPWWSWAAKRQWRANKDEKDAATESVTIVADGYAEAIQLHQALRDYVIRLDLTDGPLAEAAAGWQLPTEPPAGMATFVDEATFLAANPRRAVSPQWPDLLAGTVFGSSWRRDGDDNPDLLDRGGPWQIGHILATSEIYATRRGLHVPAGVWLLGMGFSAEKACELLLDLEPRMGQPNSLPLAAAAVIAAAEPIGDSQDL